MPAIPETDVLHRKVHQGTRRRDANVVLPPRALRQALARVAEELWGMAVTSQGISQEMLDQEGAVSRLGADDLILVLTAPDGTHAIAAIDRAVLAALIEVQTLGIVSDRAFDERPYTTTDAAMAWLYLDRVIAGFAAALQAHPMAPLAIGLRFEERAVDPRTAALFMEAAQYHAMTAAVDIAGGRRRGDVRLLLPLRHVKAPAPTPAAEARGSHAATLRMLPAPVQAVLGRITVPLSRACALRSGDLLPLPDGILDMAELVAVGDHVVAKGRLGQMNGFRAIRLTVPDHYAERGRDAPDTAATDPAPTSLPDDGDTDSALATEFAPAEPPLPVAQQPLPVAEPEDDETADFAAMAGLDMLDGLADWEEEE
ncbi:FliM/FliN family flagellar motor switch protein [Mesobacterium sp. TK19101]|uniref:FliM/FliN family flagellar motor switch protein n=1 Tax=Mesobacterium hydrothermale TaxID=3111907 RepID=A0ABU6HD54_9RHOB|nr:FliM/FliN family flagellar motor switch protein [Mesobacterium sp. TK19101]MEC3860385.1 FliM/FliN family flagellar motor switch protein [Mesobacterium sp. TK19101]